MRRKATFGLALMLVVAACGDDSGVPDSTTAPAAPVSTTTEATAVTRAGGALFTGTFEAGPGFGPGEITLLLGASGDTIETITIDPALTSFACPNGVTVTGGAYATGGDLEIDSSDSFDLYNGLSGVFDSATRAHGSYDLEYDFNCTYVLDWTATSP
jgi:hypothetical protein